MQEVDTFTSDRFEIRKRLGEGGFGTVYAAFDRSLRIPVALKRLRHPSGDALFRFKREFRSLAGVVHPNLVSLYELFQARDAWYFTMELVQGQHLFTYLRPGGSATDDTVENPLLSRRESLDEAPVPSPLPDVARLRAVFRQLAEGMLALHDAGLLHRDVKSSNVLVTDDGRVVVLDFGLVAHLRGQGEGDAAGTPLYMAPEQWLGGSATEASDWYSVGVVLYEALTGVPPFSGSVTEIAQQKLEASWAPPRVLNPAIPEDLSSLCEDLLRLSPTERPSGREVLRRLGGEARGARLSQSGAGRSRSFVGRAGELDRLRAVASETARGRAAVVHIVGESGIGKTALCERFCTELADRSDALVLRGRSYAQESLPYKALDGAVDDLAWTLSRLPPMDLVPLLPPGAQELATLFPVLRRLGPLDRRGQTNEGDARQSVAELRRRAFSALRELLKRVSDRRPVVLFLDDAHWGDLDSVGLLHTLLLPPEPPAVLLVLSYRPDEARESAFLRAFDGISTAAPEVPTVRVQVGELERTACEGLVATLLGRGERPSETYLSRVLAESGGNPLFVEELVRFDGGEAPREPGGDRHARLDDLVQRRVSELPDSWRRLVDVVALAQAPIDAEAARQAAGLPGLDGTLLNRLRASHLVRTRQADGREQIAPYHDRIRQAVATRLGSDEKRTLHGALAEALISLPETPPALVATHLHHAGDLPRAAEYALAGANRAAQAFAFDEAAELYKKVLQWHPGHRAREIRQKLADALANAGRCLEAAPLYLEAAQGADRLDALDLERLAFEQFTAGGSVRDAIPILRRLCDTLELPCPLSHAGGLASTVGDLLRLGLRGIDFRERPIADIDPQQLLRVDVLLSASRGLLPYFPVPSMGFNTRALLLGLESGDPTRIVESLAAVGTGLAVQDGGLKPFGERMLARARQIVESLADPKAKGLLLLWSAFIDYADCRWTTALASWDEALGLLRQCRGVASEVQKAQLNALLAVQMMGRFDELERRSERALADARATGNRYTDMVARLNLAIVRLAAGDVPGARERIVPTLRDAPEDDISARLTALKFECYCDLYADRVDEAVTRIDRAWPVLNATTMMRLPRFAVAFHSLYAGVLLEQSARRGGDKKLLKLVEPHARAVERFKNPHSVGRAALLRAAMTHQRGDRTSAIMHLEAALRVLDAPALATEQAYARRRLGLMLGGEEGRREIATADALLTARGVHQPARFTMTQAPGFLDTEGTRA